MISLLEEKVRNLERENEQLARAKEGLRHDLNFQEGKARDYRKKYEETKETLLEV